MCNEPEEVSRIVRDLHSPRRDIIYLMIYIFFFSFILSTVLNEIPLSEGIFSGGKITFKTKVSLEKWIRVEDKCFIGLNF